MLPRRSVLERRREDGRTWASLPRAWTLGDTAATPGSVCVLLPRGRLLRPETTPQVGASHRMLVPATRGWCQPPDVGASHRRLVRVPNRRDLRERKRLWMLPALS